MINTITPTVVDGELRLFLTVLSGQVLRRAGEAFVFDAESLQLPAKSLLDYNHNDDEIVGYCKDFTIDPKTNAVYCEAALVARPDDPSARVNEVIANIAHGATYEVSPLIDLSTASRTERLDGASSYHNATLRGVAICPHGTDADTAFVAFTSARAPAPSSRPRGGAPSSRYRADTALRAVARIARPASDLPLVACRSQNSTCKGIDMSEENTTELVADDNLELSAKNFSSDEQAPPTKEPRNAELSQMLDEFGRDRGLDFYLEGLSLDEARMKDYEELKALRAEAEKEPEAVEETPAEGEGETPEEEEKKDKEVQELRASITKLEEKLVALSALIRRGDPGVQPSHDVEEAREKPKNALMRAALKYKEMGTKRLS